MRRSPDGLAGSVLVLPILNVSGFRSRSVYVMPEDGRNLNRMFPGRPDGSYSERLAHWLVTQVYPQADAYLDLHSGDLDEALLPFSVCPSGNDAAKALAAAFGLRLRWRSAAKAIRSTPPPSSACPASSPKSAAMDDGPRISYPTRRQASTVSCITSA